MTAPKQFSAAQFAATAACAIATISLSQYGQENLDDLARSAASSVIAAQGVLPPPAANEGVHSDTDLE